MAWNMKGKVAKCDHREYGFAQVQIAKIGEANLAVDALFDGLGDEMQVFTLIASTMVTPHFSIGLDVSRRPTIGASSRLPYHRPHEYRTIRCNRAQLEAILWHPVPP